MRPTPEGPNCNGYHVTASRLHVGQTPLGRRPQDRREADRVTLCGESLVRLADQDQERGRDHGLSEKLNREPPALRDIKAAKIEPKHPPVTVPYGEG